jgi:hypothetical protein
MSSSPSTLPAYYIAFDIKTTGADLIRDEIISVGMAWSTPGGPITKWRITQDLHKPAERSWAGHWRCKGWEQRCYDQFWSKNLELLDELHQDPTLVDGEREILYFLDAKLAQIEAECAKTLCVFDTIMYDPVWLCAKMSLSGFKPLSYTRDGRWRSSYVTGPMAEAALHLDANQEWEIFSRERQERIFSLLPEYGPTANTHHPEEDAEHILASYFRIREFSRLERMKKTEDN